MAPAGPTEVEKAFEAAGIAVKTLAKPPDNEGLLGLYALYKQATAGDATGDRPGIMDVTGRAKFDAWAQRKGMDREAAMAAYTALVEKLRSA